MISEQTPIPCSPPLITRVYPSEGCTPGAFGLGCARAGGGVGGEGTHAFIKPHLISDPNTFLKLSRCFQERNCFQNARPSHIKVSGMPVGELELTPERDQSGRGLGFIWPIKEAILNKAWLHLPLADISRSTTLSDTLWPRIMAFCPEHPEWDQNPQFLSLSETMSIPVTLIWEYPLGETPYPVYQTSSSPDSLPNLRPKARRKPSLLREGPRGSLLKACWGWLL